MGPQAGDTPALILLVDDEPHITQLARLYLEREGYQTVSETDGLQALESVNRLQPALLVLDIMLPGIDGMEVCRRLRAQDNPIPIIMLTASDEDIDKIVGLELGADDYLTKPFNPRELVARVRAHLRRSPAASWHTPAPDPAAPGSAAALQPKILRLADLVIDPARHEVTIQGKPVALRHQEFNLLQVLVEHKGLVLSREQLLNLAWGYDYYGQTRTVDVHIGHLRKKLAGSLVRIETVAGDGYKLVA